MKAYFIILWSVLYLVSCDKSGSGETLITGAFGFSFGDKPAELGEVFFSELESIEISNPPLPDNRFERYFYTVTPQSHRIYQVNAVTSPNMTKSACDSLLHDLSSELKQKYHEEGEAVISHLKGKWEIRRSTKRSVSLECVVAPLPPATGEERLHKLSLSYLDYNLAAEAYKEWKKKID